MMEVMRPFCIEATALRKPRGGRTAAGFACTGKDCQRLLLPGGSAAASGDRLYGRSEGLPLVGVHDIRAELLGVQSSSGGLVGLFRTELRNGLRIFG
jgi:hypothetical protein